MSAASSAGGATSDSGAGFSGGTGVVSGAVACGAGRLNSSAEYTASEKMLETCPDWLARFSRPSIIGMYTTLFSYCPLLFLVLRTTIAASRPSGIRPSVAHLVSPNTKDFLSANWSSLSATMAVAAVRINCSGVTWGGSMDSIPICVNVDSR
uniref:Uncharacterized protein n=1 Tax=Glossina brevipalpis TaxID=37001 RepID=A0A1A9VZ31_9MUSC